MKRLTAATLILVTVFFLALVAGCGGGTSGTGQSSVLLSGTVRQSNNSPLQNAQVVFESGTDSAEGSTDANGNYSVEVALEESSDLLLSIIQEALGINTQVALGSIDPDTASATINVRLAPDNSVDSVDIKKTPRPNPTSGSDGDGNSPAPDPTATALPDGSDTEPTSTPNQPPTATKPPAAGVPTAEPTKAPAFTPTPTLPPAVGLATRTPTPPTISRP